jgi:hypothetical protein
MIFVKWVYATSKWTVSMTNWHETYCWHVIPYGETWSAMYGAQVAIHTLASDMNGWWEGLRAPICGLICGGKRTCVWALKYTARTRTHARTHTYTSGLQLGSIVSAQSALWRMQNSLILLHLREWNEDIFAIFYSIQNNNLCKHIAHFG